MTALEVAHTLRGKRSGDGWRACCPAHDDKHASLSISEGNDGKLLLKCHAECEFQNILAAISHTNGNGSRIIAEYDYRDESGKLAYQSVRFEPKDFRGRKPDGNGGWEWKLNGTRRIPYHLPELLAADPQRTVLIVEGEKDVDNLAKLGLIATTNIGGAGKWRPDYHEHLRGRKVVVIPDNDAPGRKHAQQVAESVQGVAASVKVVELPGLPEKGDVSDWLAAGNGVKQLRDLVTNTTPFELAKQNDSGLKIVRMADVEPEAVEWLWQPYIALGKLTLLEGDPGIGKSWITAALASAVSLGHGLPGMKSFESGNVLMLSAEDGLADTLRPRLDVVGANVLRVFALNEPLIFDEPGLLRLEAAIIEHKPVLVTVDPLFAFTGGKIDIHRANECRTVTAKLAAIAEKSESAFVAIRHLGKSRGMGHALNAGIGSIDLVAAARSVLLAGKDPDDDDKRAIVQIKSNLAPPGAAVGFTLRGGEFFWTGESDLTAERILSYAPSESERPALNDAAEFLRDELADGECDVATLKADARRAGISEITLRRAKERLGARAIKRGAFKDARWFWTLAEDAPAASEDAQKTVDEHLRTSGANKASYSNELAEDAHGSDSEHLRGGYVPTFDDPDRQREWDSWGDSPSDKGVVLDEIYFPPADTDETLEREAVRSEACGEL